MRRYKMIVRILLILSVLSSAFAATVSVREAFLVHVDVADVTGKPEDVGTAATSSRRWWDPWDQSSTNAPDCENAPLARVGGRRRIGSVNSLNRWIQVVSGVEQ